MIQFETKHFPLVLLNLGSSERTPEDLRGFLAGFHDVNRQARAEGKRWALVVLSESPPNPVERKVIIEEANKFSKEDHELTVVTVTVIPNSIIRSVATAFGWMLRNSAPLAFAPTVDAAVDLAVERLRAVGLRVLEPDVVHAKRWFLRDESMMKVRAADGRGVAR